MLFKDLDVENIEMIEEMAHPMKRVKVRGFIPNRNISDLVEAMGKTGFQGRRLSEAVEVIAQMIADRDTTVLMGYAGSLSVAGQWKITSGFKGSSDLIS